MKQVEPLTDTEVMGYFVALRLPLNRIYLMAFESARKRARLLNPVIAASDELQKMYAHAEAEKVKERVLDLVS